MLLPAAVVVESTVVLVPDVSVDSVEYSVHKDISCYEVVTIEKSVYLWDGKNIVENHMKKCYTMNRNIRAREGSRASFKSRFDSVMGKENYG